MATSLRPEERKRLMELAQSKGFYVTDKITNDELVDIEHEQAATALQVEEFCHWADKLEKCGLKIEHPKQYTAAWCEEKLGYIRDYVGEVNSLDATIQDLIHDEALAKEPTPAAREAALRDLFKIIYAGEWGGTTDDLAGLLVKHRNA